MERRRDIEKQRLILQAELDAKKTAEARNVMGQFATPTELARSILRYTYGLLSKSEPVRFLDPGIGTGSFYSALRAEVPSKRIKAAEGFEIDPHYGEPAKKLWSHTSLKIHLRDFTGSEPHSDEANRFNLLVCNPPYVRHHHIVSGDKGRLQHRSEEASGVRIAGLAGLYCYFMAIAHPWMSRGGLAAWLIPSEFMDVNYGRALKQYLLTKVHLLRIHRFDPNDVQFGDALVSSAIVFFRNELPPAAHTVDFTFGGEVERPNISRSIPASVLLEENKWTRFPIADAREKHVGLTLGDLFKIKRGLATGDNRFFILAPDEIDKLEVPKEFCKPILPSPRYLDGDHVQADREGNPKVERKLFLLDCRLPEDEVREKYPKFWAYLQTGKPSVAERYLCRYRKPWYSQEERPAAPFICTYLGRSDKKNGKPFRFIWNESNATAANVYLLLYPQPQLAKALRSDKALARKVWAWLNSIKAEDLLGEGRVYGGGLHKLEPKELSNVPADEIAQLVGFVVPSSSLQGDLFRKKVA